MNCHKKSRFSVSRSKLSDEQKAQIVADYKNGQSIIQLTKIFKTSSRLVTMLLTDACVLRRKIAGRKKRLTSQQRLLILEKYKEGESTATLSVAFSVTQDQIGNILKRFSITLRREKKLTKPKPIKSRYIIPSDQMAQLLLDYELGEPVKSIAKRLGVSGSCLLSTLRRGGATIRRNSLKLIRPEQVLFEPKFTLEQLPNFSYSGIYKFTNLINNKIYIGQAKNITKRFKDHYRANGKAYFHRAIRKYGIGNFDFEVVERVDNLSLLNKREQYWMDALRAYDLGVGYNLAKEAGSCRGAKRTPEQLEAQRRRMIGKLAGPLNPLWGKTHTPEARAKISQARKKAKASLETRNKLSITSTRNNLARTPELLEKIAKATAQAHNKPIAQIDLLTGRTISVWGSVGEISTNLKISVSGIQNACKGRYYCTKRKGYFPKSTHGGYGWQYVDPNPTTGV